MCSLILYRVNGSCSIVPHSILLHFGIPFSAVRLKSGPNRRYEAADGSFSHSEYLAINPTGFVPAVIINDIVITEMPAVLTYIATRIPNKDLLGKEGLERAKAVEWMAWLSGTLHSDGFGALWRPYRFADDGSAHATISTKGREVIETCYRRIEERLTGRSWAVGESLTLVDFNLYVFWRWGHEIGNDMQKEYPTYGHVMRKVEGLEGVTRAVELEEEVFYFK